MSAPLHPVEVPDRVRALAGAAVPVPVWRNELDGLTFRAGAVFITWGRRHGEARMKDEAARLAGYGVDPDPARTACYRALWDAA